MLDSRSTAGAAAARLAIRVMRRRKSFMVAQKKVVLVDKTGERVCVGMYVRWWSGAEIRNVLQQSDGGECSVKEFVIEVT